MSDKQQAVGNTTQSSYRSILKATSLFGGVQAFQIIVSVAKAKILAVLLGPVGVGILGLFNSALELINNITAFGLPQSAVREVAESNSKEEVERVNHTVSLVRILVFVTGIIGVIVTIVGAPLWSKISFGNYDYIIPFCLLSVSAFVDKLFGGEKVVLQGLRRYKDLAKSSVLGSLFGLIISIPIYYFFGVKGIVPTLILNSFTMFIMTWLFSKKARIPYQRIKIKDAFSQGRGMIIMGVAMSLTGILGTLIAYIIRSVIRLEGGLADVGIYTAGYTLLFTYTGLIFSAMSTDYYPRLAAVNSDNKKCSEIANQQAEIGILILAPLLVAINIFISFVISILYSDDFMPARLFVLFSSLGMIFKMASWSISYILVAKAESRLFAINETIANINVLIFNIIGYHFWGVPGLGISTTIAFVAYFLQIYYVAKRKYEFSYSVSFIKLFLVIGLLIIASIIIKLLSVKYGFIIEILLLIVVCIYSFRELNSRINLTQLLHKAHE